ncbi:hypothetical protein AOR_1_1860154 [Paecilomyces variotii No. 5]|uniref:Uncharacterized protein n=1 Tax=Byssochlamys spectabilis (strain No. 5 / NBRC 109023) TaxID=1356009 RepID=V5G840_BYSSN|nr:hypothetical protein AOR_1_1860154 [Paecilomyces variotii No. 5]
MKQLRRPAGDDTDELVTEINSSTRNGLTRGVKRRCLDIDSSGIAIAGEIERGRSFLETKWELGTTRRRKYATHTECDRPTSQPDAQTNFQAESGTCSHDTEPAVENSMQNNQLIPSDEDPESSSGSPDENASLDGQLASDVPVSPTQNPSCDQPGQETKPTSVCEDAKAGENVADKDVIALAQAFNSDCHRQDTQESHESGQSAASPAKASRIRRRSSPGLDGPFPTISVVIENKSQSAASEGKSLIAEEATLIRSALRSSALDGDDEELLSDFLSRAKAKRAANAAGTPKDGDQSVPADLLPESPTPRSRRALEELDTNSPSLQPASPVKNDGAADEDRRDAEPVEPEDQLASPTRRRSSRAKPKKASKRAAPPAVPKEIPVRRPKGTEFVFLQRTEAQDLALATRRNTKRNRGTAQMPKQMLAALAQRLEEDSDSTTSPSRSHRRRGKKGKTVSWSEQLVEYERDGGDDVATSHVGARRGRIARRSCAGASANSASVSTTAAAAVSAPSSASSPAPPAPATPRARRLPLPGALSPANKLAPDASLIPTAITTSSEADLSHRKRLAPKAPSAALLGASKGAITRSRLPARTTANSTSSKTTVKSKTASILHAGAGSTPMPKRVRARR